MADEIPYGYVPREEDDNPVSQQKAAAKPWQMLQRGVVAEVGLGKTTITLDQLPNWIAGQKQQNKPYRVLIAVPDHALSGEMLSSLENRGISAAVWKGRTFKDENEDHGMCMRPEVAELAAKYLLPAEQIICGNPKDGPERLCPHYYECSYQRQKTPVYAADVIVAAHDMLFHQLPKEISHDLGAIIIDESWWQKGLLLMQEIGIADLASKVNDFPPLRIEIDLTARAAAYPAISKGPEDNFIIRNIANFDPANVFPPGKNSPRIPRAKKGEPPRPKVVDRGVQTNLHNLCIRLMEALATLPDGSLITREACRIAGITPGAAHTAIAWEWQRQVKPDVHAGMALPDMRKAVAGAENNIQVKRRAGMWRAIKDMLHSTHDACGRLQVRTVCKRGAEIRVIWFHERKPLAVEILDLPVLYLDATPPAVNITRCYLPHYEQSEMIRADAPHQRVIQIIGPWAKSKLLPEPGNPFVSADENTRREDFLKEIRDFVAYHAQGEKAVIFSHKGAETYFRDVPNLRVGHFNKLRGQNVHGDVRHLFILGRPFAPPEQTRITGMALTGEPLPLEQPQFLGQYVHMRDGHQRIITVTHYDNQTLEAIHAAVATGEIAQTIGRARGINRESHDPVAIWLLTDVASPWPLDILLTWPEVAPTVWERMAGRGLILDSPTDSAAFYPDLFVSRKAADLRTDRSRSEGVAWRHFANIGVAPSFILILGNDAMLRFHNVSYKLKGSGQRTREAWVAPERAATVAADIAAALKTELVFCRVAAPRPGTVPDFEDGEG